jgi:hypothetical protein
LDVVRPKTYFEQVLLVVVKRIVEGEAAQRKTVVVSHGGTPTMSEEELKFAEWAASCSLTLENCNPKSVPLHGKRAERLGSNMRKDLHVLCYEHHAEMLLEYRNDPAETSLYAYACRESACFIRYSSLQGYFIESQDADKSDLEIKPAVHCPKDWCPMYLAEVQPGNKSFRLWKCPECNTTHTNGEFSSAAASPG